MDLNEIPNDDEEELEYESNVYIQTTEERLKHVEGLTAFLMVLVVVFFIALLLIFFWMMELSYRVQTFALIGN